VIALLLRLYPARWRDRYGDEFAAILESRPLGPFDVADVVLGALDAHLHLRGLGAATSHGKGFTMSLRIGGYAAVVGAILWVVGFGVASVDQSDAVWPWVVFLSGTVALLIALAGLSAFEARRYPRLVWAAFAVPAVGALMSAVGLVATALRLPGALLASMTPWEVWFVGLILFVAGSGLFGVACLRTGGLSRLGAAMLLVAGLAVVPMLAGTSGVVTWEPIVGALFAVLLIAFVGGWILLGIGAIRSDRRSFATVGGLT